VRKYVTSALIGDREYFEKLSDLRVRISNAYIKEMELSRMKSEVEVASREKNYEQVVKLYDLEDDLSLSEIKEVRICETKVVLRI
jgi:hypothetical protein